MANKKAKVEEVSEDQVIDDAEAGKGKKPKISEPKAEKTCIVLLTNNPIDSVDRQHLRDLSNTIAQETAMCVFQGATFDQIFELDWRGKPPGSQKLPRIHLVVSVFYPMGDDSVAGLQGLTVKDGDVRRYPEMPIVVVGESSSHDVAIRFSAQWISLKRPISKIVEGVKNAMPRPAEETQVSVKEKTVAIEDTIAA